MKRLLNINKCQDGTKLTPTRELIINLAWTMENPGRRGLAKNGYLMYPDPNGRDWNVGPGLKVGASIGNKSIYSKEELDEAAYLYGLLSLDSIGLAYNKLYGTSVNPDPWKDVDINSKLLLLDTRYLNGSIPTDKWPSLYDSIYKNDILRAIRESRSTYERNGKKIPDNDRVRRRLEYLYPGLFTFSIDKNGFPVIEAIKKAFGGRLIPKAGIGTALKFLPKLPKAKFYRYVTAKALPSYKKYGVITLRDAGSHYSVPMFSKNSPSQHRLQTQTDGDIWIVPKDNAPLEWETVKGLVVTPKYQGEYNKAPVSWFDFYLYHVGKGYEKLQDLNVSPTSHIDYLKSLDRELQIDYLVKNGLNDLWLWTLENNPDHLENALRGAIIP